MSRLFLTGASGWFGQALLHAFAGNRPDLGQGMVNRFELDAPIVALVRNSTEAARIQQIGDHVMPVVGDLRDVRSVKDFLSEAEGATLIHGAGVIHPRFTTRSFHRTNVEASKTLIDEAVRVGVRRVIVLSSNSVAGMNKSRTDPFTESSPYAPYQKYGRSKVQLEKLVNDTHERSGIETVILRAPWFYGPYQPDRQSKFFSLVKRGRFPLVGDGNNLRSMVYVGNLCQAVLLAALVENADGLTYWISDARNHSLNEILDTLRNVLSDDFGFSVKHSTIRLPKLTSTLARSMDTGLQAIGLYHPSIHVLSELDQDIYCSIERATNELDYNPQIDLRVGLQKSVEWCIDNGHKI